MYTFNTSNQKIFGLFYFKAGCLLFWACWFSLVFITNLFDFANALGALPADWHFRSGNYNLLVNVIAIYDMPTIVVNILFICDIGVQGLAAILFFIACIYYLRHQCAWPIINIAFVISIALQAVFILMEEVFISYQFENVHRQLFIFELLTWMALYLLPEDDL